jgi:hypothetical protein
VVPEAYRLEQVVVRLIERLEGARRSHADPAKASAEFERIAADHVEAAIGEFGEVALEEPGPHADFLRREVLGTFLPRYTAQATQMTATESAGYGLGRVADPLGRLVLIAVAFGLLYLDLRFLFEVRAAWPFIGVLAMLPFSPDFLAMFHRRRYRTELQSIVDDMARIQSNSNAYIPAERLRTTDPQPTASSNKRRTSADREPQ